MPVSLDCLSKTRTFMRAFKSISQYSMISTQSFNITNGILQEPRESENASSLSMVMHHPQQQQLSYN